MTGWRRVRIGDVCDIIKGETGLASATPGQYPMVATGAERRSCNTYQFDTEAVCIPLVSSTGHGKKTLNYVHYQSGKFALGTILAAVIPKDPKVLTARYLHLYLSHFKDTVLVPLMKGAANVSLPMKGIASVEIPVPTVEMQQKLIDLIGRIESEHRELLEEGNRQAGLFKQLRQAVLQEAVEGKLTADWRKNVEKQFVETQNLASLQKQGNPLYDASALLSQIKAEKERLVKTGKIPRRDNGIRRDAKSCVSTTSEITDAEKPFELPDAWAWCRLGELSELITSGSRDWASFYRDDGRAKFVRMGNLSHDSYQLKQEKIQRVEPPATGEGTRTRLVEGDLLVSITGDVGWMGLVPTDFGEAYINQHTSVVRLISLLRTTLIPKFLLSPLGRKQFNEPQRGIKNSFRLTDLFELLLPLPPLAEQQAIVARVDSLMATIDALEAQRVETQNLASLLMQAVLREAFAGQSEGAT
jgi:type I restriction enzyme S subunit